MTDKEIYDKVVALAYSEGYNDIIPQKDWNGYKVYAVWHTDFIYSAPQAILANNKEIRLATIEETHQALFPVTPEMEKEKEELKSLLPELFS